MAEIERIAKFVPAFFLDVVNDGQEFPAGKWPPHITTFPPLEQPYNRQFGDQMRELLNPCNPFMVTVGEDDWFGDNNDILVKRIKPSLELQGLHYMLTMAVGDLIHDTTYRQPYSPHIAVERPDQLLTGTSINIGGFAIVQKFKSESWVVVDKVGLKGGR